MQEVRPSLVGFIIWWVALAIVGALIALALVDVAYSRVVYLFIVMPLAGALLFPVAYVANKRLSPRLKPWFRR